VKLSFEIAPLNPKNAVKKSAPVLTAYFYSPFYWNCWPLKPIDSNTKGESFWELISG